MLGPISPKRRSDIGTLLGFVVLLWLAVLGQVSPTEAQEPPDLPLKVQVPGEASPCSPAGAPLEPTPNQRAQASQIGSSASQALLLGDRERARDLLREATQLDPTSADLAYRYGRSLEELGETEAAIEALCRFMTLDAPEADIADAEARLRALQPVQLQISEEAAAAFEAGLFDAGQGRLLAAVDGFERAAGLAPDWPEASYNHGVVLARLGRRDEARVALRRYLELAPDAPDAIAVSERIGELQVVSVASNLPSPAAAFAVGLVPGLGQVYTGRPAEGLGFMTVAGGHLATALLYDRGIQPPFKGPGLAIAGATTLVSAIDALLYAKRARAGADLEPPDPGAALALGIVPGLGQVYSGRTATGLGFLSLTAFTVTASDLLETRDVRRFAPQGMVVAGALTFIGALEAFVMADLHQGPDVFRPNPWATLGLGIIPGMGQFYAGRTGMGMAVLSVAASFTTAGLIYRIGRGVTFRDQGIALGAGTIAFGAIEGFIWALRHQDDDVAARPGPTPNEGITLEGPALLGAGRSMEMRLVGLRF
jgi:Flp pilus assembly protein TadD/TM2 domain-containing membrane protein YozV